MNFIYLPSGDGAKKMGLDDFFAQGGTVDELLALATTELRKPVAAENERRELPYAASEYGLVWNRRSAEGVAAVPLTNFDARIVTQTEQDDGANINRVLTIETRLNGVTRQFDVPSETFASMNWVMENLGAKAVVYPGQGIRDHLRVAIQSLSDATERKVRTHTGWIEMADGTFGYCHAGGIITASDVALDMAEVRMNGPLARYELPTPPALHSPELKDAIESVLNLLKFGKPGIVIATIAAVFRAILGNALFSVFVVGPTGVFKTQLVAIAQQFIGAAMTANQLPADWSATDNYLEGLAFLAKDAVIVFDEFVPQGSVHDRNRYHAKADRVLRAQGNSSGRGRMRSDTTLRAARPPRGLIMSTGEDIPKGQSLRARMLVIEIAEGDLPANQLACYQKDASDGKYALVTSGLIQWLAPQLSLVRQQLVEKRGEFREKLRLKAPHRRTTDIACDLVAGLNLFFYFAHAAGVISREQRKALFDAASSAFQTAADRQEQHQKDNEPTRRFIELLSAVLASGRAHLAGMDGGPPLLMAKPCGWRSRYIGSGATETEEYIPKGDCIGYLDGDSIYLIPASAYRTANQMAESGDGIAVTPQILYKRLSERGLLLSREAGRERRTIRKMISGQRLEVLHLHRNTILPTEEPSQPSQPALSIGYQDADD